jgi:hypothetical protein
MALNLQALMKDVECLYFDQILTSQEKWLVDGMN